MSVDNQLADAYESVTFYWLKSQLLPAITGALMPGGARLRAD
ncbi:MAG: hypothetical protein ACLR7M_08355 [Varibaculum timonense]